MPLATANNDDFRLMKGALTEARAGFDEGGVPVGSVLVKEGEIISAGRNRRVQDGDPVAHAEMDCIRRAGRRTDYSELTLYTTMSPCMMCAGTILQFGIGRVVIGDNQNFAGEMELLSDKSVEVALVNDPGCIALFQEYEQSAHGA